MTFWRRHHGIDNKKGAPKGSLASQIASYEASPKRHFWLSRILTRSVEPTGNRNDLTVAQLEGGLRNEFEQD